MHIGNKTVKLKIWDTAGQERFRNITTQYYKNADGILLVFDVSDKASFDKTSQWLNQIKTNNSNDHVVVLLVGNKCDVEDRQVSVDQAEAFAKEYGLNYFETSALTNYNIDDAFAFLAGQIIEIKIANQNKFKEYENPNPILKIEENSKHPIEMKSKQKKCC